VIEYDLEKLAVKDRYALTLEDLKDNAATAVEISREDTAGHCIVEAHRTTAAEHTTTPRVMATLQPKVHVKRKWRFTR